MNMPSFNNHLVHQVNVEHAESQSLEDFIDALTRNDFVMVEEFYRDPQTGLENSRGHLALNHRYVGKIKIMNGEILSKYTTEKRSI
jgi:hypothetical protein